MGPRTRSFCCGFVTGILTKDHLLKCLILASSYLIIFPSNFFNLPYAEKIYGVVVAFLPEVIGIIFVLGFGLLYNASLLFLNWLRTKSSPKVLKFFRIILIVESMLLMVYLEYNVIHDAYLFLITLQNPILRLAIRSWIALVILSTIEVIYCVLDFVRKDLRERITIPHPIAHFRLAIPIYHTIISVFVVTFLIAAYAILTGFGDHYWALAYFPQFLGLIYLSFIFPHGIFAFTTLYWYVMLCFSVFPHDILIKLRLKHEPLLLSEKIFTVCFQFLFEASLIGFSWLGFIWIWVEGYLVKELADLVILLFLVDH